MSALLFSAADFLKAMQALLPRGRVWQRSQESVQAAVLSGLSAIYERLTARAAVAITEAFPSSTYELLAEWEASLGLPDPCQGAAPGVESRRNQVVARFIGNAGQSVNYFIGFAATLGYEVTITQFVPSRFGMPFGGLLNGDDWAHAWQVNAPQFKLDYFLFGTSGMGEPFSTWGNDILQCELRHRSPAQTILIFNYS